MTGPASSSGTIPARQKLPLASVCETKPISRGRAGMGEGRQGRQCRYHWAKACETKPIPPGRRDGQVLCGKRVMTNWTRKRRRQNKANSRTDRNGQGPARLPSAAGGTNRVKQSQFAADGQGRPSPRPEALTMPPVRRQVRQTKPIRRKHQEGQVPCGRRVMTNWTREGPRQNKANSRTDRNMLP